MSTIKIKGNSKTYDEAAGANVKINGSANTVDMADGGSVDIVAGGSDHIDMSNGSLTLAAGTTGNLTGSVDGVNGAASDSLIVAGSNDAITMGTGGYVKISSGNGDAVSVNDGNVVTGSGVTNYSVNGSGNTLTAGAGNSVDIAGSSDSLYMTSGDVVTILSGTNEAMSLSDGTLTMDASGSDVLLAGSDDSITGVSSDQINVSGSNDDITVDGSAYVGILGGNDDIINMNGGSIATAGTVTNLLINGSDNIIGGGIDGSLNVNGSGNAISTQSPGYVGILAGDSDVVAMNNQSIDLASGVTNAYITGSGDVIAVSAGDDVIVTGTSDSIYAAEGSTVILSASDSGDTINLIGGSIVVGAGVTNVTIVGTGDQFSGAGASLVGAITTTVTENVGPGGTLEPETVTTVPAVVYNAGDIQDIVNYFEANPYLSQSEIQAVESDSNYTANLDTYLASANLYGSPNALPSNVLAMLDGYSAVYTALAGVPTEVFSEDAYIEQQFGWAEENYPMPATIQVEGNIEGIGSILQNLMPVLESTNTNTQSLVSDAIGLLEYGNAGAPGGNQTPMLSDTTAEMLLAIAESPGFSAATQSSTEVYTPGRSGHWEIVANGDGTYTQTFKSPPLIETVLSDLDTYVAPIIDIAAVLTANPEFLLATGLSSAVATGVEVAATAINLTQAGQDFAAGDDLQGVLGVIEAVGGAFQEIGKAEGLSVGACSTTNGLQQFGEALSEGGAVAQGIDGVVAGAQSGNILAAITSGLGGVAGVAGLANASSIQQYAAVGEELGSTALAGQRGDILAALDGLVQAAQTSGALTAILQEVEKMFMSFTQASVGVGTEGSYDLRGTAFSTAAVPEAGTSGAAEGDEYFPLINQNTHQPVGYYLFDPQESDNVSNIATAQALANADNGSYFIIAGHGVSQSDGPNSADGLSAGTQSSDSDLSLSPQALLATAEHAGYVEGSKEAIVLDACNTAEPFVIAGNPADDQGSNPTSAITYNGVILGESLAQSLATYADAPVRADAGYVITPSPNSPLYGTGAYLVDNIPGTEGSPAFVTQENNDFNSAVAAYEAAHNNQLPGPGAFALLNGATESWVPSKLNQ